MSKKFSQLAIIFSCLIFIACSKKEESKETVPTSVAQTESIQPSTPPDVDTRLFEFAKKCYATTKLMAVALTADNGKNADIYTLMTAVQQKIITDHYISKESDSKKGSLIYDELFNSYKAKNLKDEEVNTEYGKSVIAEHGRLDNECAEIMKNDTELASKWQTLMSNYVKSNSTSGSDPKEVAEKLQIAGVSRCIATTIIMSASLTSSPNFKIDGPEIKNNSSMMDFYSQAKNHLIQSSKNPAVASAIDSMVKQQSDYFGNIVRAQGWEPFLPEYKKCKDYTN